MSPSDTENAGSARGSDEARAELLSQAIADFQANKIEKADAAYTTLLDQDPDNLSALIGAAICTARLRRDIAGALDLLDRADTVAPNTARVHQTRSAMLNSAGDFTAAVAAARRALAIDPGCALAYINLTDSTKVTANDPIFEMAAQALTRASLPNSDRGLIHFALGKAHQDCGHWDAAFDNFKSGNDSNPASDQIPGFTEVVKRQRDLFSPAFSKTLKGAARTNPRPAFIIGMPRSGTTLLERMLAGHPDVSTAGERTEMATLTSDFVTQAQDQSPDLPATDAIRKMMSRDNLAVLARAYLTKVVPHADHPRAPVLIDKMPMNFWRTGIIAAVFADAPVLHIRRHPLDVCVSNFAANFQTGLTVTNRMDSLGAYFRLYDDLMRHFERVFPGRIIPVNYEDLVLDSETQLRRILAACDLDWHPDCAHPEQTKGMIATASRWQARQKVYQSSVQKWRRYESHLGPLIDALGGMEWIADYEARRFPNAAGVSDSAR